MWSIKYWIFKNLIPKIKNMFSPCSTPFCNHRKLKKFLLRKTIKPLGLSGFVVFYGCPTLCCFYALLLRPPYIHNNGKQWASNFFNYTNKGTKKTAAVAAAFLCLINLFISYGSSLSMQGSRIWQRKKSHTRLITRCPFYCKACPCIFHHSNW